MLTAIRKREYLMPAIQLEFVLGTHSSMTRSGGRELFGVPARAAPAPPPCSLDEGTGECSNPGEADA